jgi:hypothetical protein
MLLPTVNAQTSAKNQTPAADWPMYNRDLAGTRYSPLTQINTRNVTKLTKAWSFKLNARASEATPIRGRRVRISSGGGTGDARACDPHRRSGFKAEGA